ncbi:MAG: hypothetical protein Q7T04_07960 [Dehalococcoidia bacterium]|nr:hypothetical protein [Dehalococcoidia bacterium]
MQWELIVALVLAIPVALFPLAYVGYLTTGGIVEVAREAGRKALRGKKAEEVA